MARSMSNSASIRLMASRPRAQSARSSLRPGRAVHWLQYRQVRKFEELYASDERRLV
jgi:hypothetical protein